MPPSDAEKVVVVVYEAGGVIKSFFPICTVLDLHNCCRQVSVVHHPAIMEVMMYIVFNLALSLIDRFPHKQIRRKVITLFTDDSRNTDNKNCAWF